MKLEQKYAYLKEYVSNLGSVAVAFSGGVDSTLLLKVVHEVLGDNVIAVTVESAFFPRSEMSEAIRLAKDIGVKHIVVRVDILKDNKIRQNCLNRCYYCKRRIFRSIQKIAEVKGFSYIIDGSNYDDAGDFRPGFKATAEMGVLNPLKEAHLTKDEIRTLAKRLNLTVWDKPAYSCLATRIPYGCEINEKKLRMVEKAERSLRKMGFEQLRVRHHGDIARIEVAKEERKKFFSERIMDEVTRKLENAGFVYVALDLRGYRRGSMNEVLKKKGEVP